MTFKRCLRILLASLFIASLSNSFVFAQASKKAGPSQEEIERSLAELLPSLEEGSNSLGTESETPGKLGANSNEESSFKQVASDEDIVAELQAQFDEISKTKRRDLTKEQRNMKSDIGKRLKFAKTINLQLKNTKRTKLAANKGRKSEEDSFVIATIEVAAQSNSADIRFSHVDGQVGATNELYRYLEQTPAQGFRDYRILGRHITGELASQATEAARQEYDAGVEYQQKMIAYIQSRQKEMARIKSSKRC